MSRSDDGIDERSGEETPIEDRGEQPLRYLFPVDGQHPHGVLNIVCDLVSDADAELVVASPVVLPDEIPLDAPDPREEGRRRAADLVFEAKQRCAGGRRIDQVVETGQDRDAILQEIVDVYSISMLVTEDHPRTDVPSLLGVGTSDDTGMDGDCDRVVVTRIERLDTIESVLVPIARGPHSGMAIDIGLALARQNDASLELLHVYESGEENAHKLGEEVLERGMERVGEFENTVRTLCRSDDVGAAVGEYSQSADVTVLGAPREGRLRRFFLETVPDEVDARTDRTTLIAHRGGAEGSWLDKLV